MVRSRVASVLLAGALVVAACGDAEDDVAVAPDPSTGTAAGPTSSSTTGTSGDVAVPDELDFVAPDVRGGQVVGAELAGRDLVIWFWAPW